MNKRSLTSRKNNHRNLFRVMALLTLTIFLSNVAFAQGSSMEAFTGLSDVARLSILLGMLIFEIIILYSIANAFKGLTANVNLWKKRLGKTTTAALLGTMLIYSNDTFAQGAGSFTLDPQLETMLIVLNGILLLIIVMLLLNVRKLIAALQQEEGTSYAGGFLGLTDAVPIEREDEIMTDHDYDGIHELDNNLPPWWVLGFYITIFFAVVYWAYYEVYLDEPISKIEFAQEMKAAEESKAAMAETGDVIDENNVTLLTDEASLEGGKAIYDANCAACHKPDGGGSVGPNLTDEYWIHGGGIKNVFKTITHGVPEKGMISWESMLSPKKRQEVASYILVKLQGTNPADAKEPQGEIWKEAATENSSNTEQADTTAAVPDEGE